MSITAFLVDFCMTFMDILLLFCGHYAWFWLGIHLRSSFSILCPWKSIKIQQKIGIKQRYFDSSAKKLCLITKVVWFTYQKTVFRTKVFRFVCPKTLFKTKVFRFVCEKTLFKTKVVWYVYHKASSNKSIFIRVSKAF